MTSIEKIKNYIIFGITEDINNPDYNSRLTLLPKSFIDNVENCINETLQNNIEGDFVECGVWRGGACILAYNMYKILNSTKKVWVYDSFEGVPPPNAEKYPMDSNDPHWSIADLSISLETVKNNFKLFGDIDDNVKFVKGWFRDTMPENTIDKISVLRLDGDMYESTIDPLEYLYPKLSIGGYCIIDDYTPKYGAYHATNDYRQKYDIKDELHTMEYNGVVIGFWKKSK